MTRISRKKLTKDRWSRLENHFLKAVALLKNEHEAQNFFHDLLTPTETKMLSKRIAAAKLLIEGKSYYDIRKELSLGNSTIANISNWLEQGSGALKQVVESIVRSEK